jgi:hypothetical protein
MNAVSPSGVVVPHGNALSDDEAFNLDVSRMEMTTTQADQDTADCIEYRFTSQTAA